MQLKSRPHLYNQPASLFRPQHSRELFDWHFFGVFPDSDVPKTKTELNTTVWLLPARPAYFLQLEGFCPSLREHHVLPESKPNSCYHPENAWKCGADTSWHSPKVYFRCFLCILYEFNFNFYRLCLGWVYWLSRWLPVLPDDSHSLRVEGQRQRRGHRNPPNNPPNRVYHHHIEEKRVGGRNKGVNRLERLRSVRGYPTYKSRYVDEMLGPVVGQKTWRLRL